VADHQFLVADTLSWQHPEGERVDLVHLLLDVVTDELHGRPPRHRPDHVVATGGRLVVSQYGEVPPSRSAEAILRRAGLEAAGRLGPQCATAEREASRAWI
jgi:hypothetical protein